MFQLQLVGVLGWAEGCIGDVAAGEGGEVAREAVSLAQHAFGRGAPGPERIFEVLDTVWCYTLRLFLNSPFSKKVGNQCRKGPQNQL